MSENINNVEIDKYINKFPIATQEKLQQIRKVIHEAVPNIKEVISYGMPAFKVNKVLVYFAAYEKHIGFYPTPSAITYFKKDLSGYVSSKGAVQFPLNKSIPFSLIAEITKFRADEDSL